MDKRIYLSPPDLDGTEREFLLDAFDSNWITTLGPHVDAFEMEMRDQLGVGGAVALSSGTAALHLSLVMLGVQRGDVVLCSDFTFAATANAIRYCGATPVFIDSDLTSWNMDADLLSRELKQRAVHGDLPKAVVVVDLYGQCADYDRILQTLAEYDIPLIEDAAEALGAVYHGQKAGTFGTMGVLSFNGNKIITTSGGGMLVSDDVRLTDRARYLATQAREPVPYYEHKDIGYNYRLSNLLAAVGRGQLQSLSKKVARRREINSFYKRSFADLPGLTFMPEIPGAKSTFWLTCLTIDRARFGASNEDVRVLLEKNSIESRYVWKPMHLQPVFKECRFLGSGVSDSLFANGLCLPSGSGLTDTDLERIVGIVRSANKG